MKVFEQVGKSISIKKMERWREEEIREYEEK